MADNRKRSLVLWTLPLLIIASSCSAQPECDSMETRQAILQYISSDHINPLIDFAAKEAVDAAPGAKSSNADGAKPMYLLGQRMVTTSTSKDKLTLRCSGALSVTIKNLEATKEVNFTVQKSPDGKLSVSVDPFQF